MREDFSRLRLPREVVAAFPPNATGLFDAFRALMTDDLLEVIARCDYEYQVDEHLAALKELRDNGVAGPIGWNPNEVLTLFRWSGEYTGQHGLTSREFHQAVGFCASALTVVPDHVENRTTPGADNLIVLFDVVTELQPSFDRLYASFLTHSLETLDPWENDFIDCAFTLTAFCVLRDDRSYADFREPMVDWFVQTQAEIVPWFSKVCGWVHFSRVPGKENDSDDMDDVMEPADSFAYVSNGILGAQWGALCDKVVAKRGQDDDFNRVVAEAGAIHRKKSFQLNAVLKAFSNGLPGFFAAAGQAVKRKVGEAASKLGTWLMKFGGKKPN